MGVLGATASVLLLTACSEPQTGVMGLSAVDGRLIASVRMFDGATSDRIELVDSGFALFGWGRPTWQFDAVESAEVDLGDIGDFVERFEDDEVLSLTASSTIGVGPYLRFSSTDLEAISVGGMLINGSSANQVIDQNAEALDEERVRLCEISF